MESQSTPDPQPITLKDVLRAIFMPPREDRPMILPLIHLPQLDLPPDEQAAIFELPDDIDSPAVIHYEQLPIESVGEVSPVQLATVGIGVIVAILISYLAASALSNPIVGLGGFLLAGIAGFLWLGILMFEFAPPDGGLLRRGPTTTGGGAARPLAVLENREMAERFVMGLLATALSAATYIFTAGNQFTLAGFLAWVLSVMLWMITLSERTPEQLVASMSTTLSGIRSGARPSLRTR